MGEKEEGMIRVEKRDRSPRPIRPRLLNHRHVYEDTYGKWRREGRVQSVTFVCG